MNTWTLGHLVFSSFSASIHICILHTMRITHNAVMLLGVSNVTRRVCAKSKFWQGAKKERQNMDKLDTLQDLPFSVSQDGKRERSYR